MPVVHAHPLSSFCWKLLIALYESDLTFEYRQLNLGDEAERAAFRALWPIGKMPVWEGDEAGAALPETSIILEHLALTEPSPRWLLPEDPRAALEVRLRDRFYDLYVMMPMQQIVADRIRPAEHRDPFGVARAKDALRTGFDLVETRFAPAPWAAGEAFSMADCAAAPALFYANEVLPFGTTHPKAAEYLARISARPSFARVLAEAAPYRHFFPRDPDEKAA